MANMDCTCSSGRGFESTKGCQNIACYCDTAPGTEPGNKEHKMRQTHDGPTTSIQYTGYTGCPKSFFTKMKLAFQGNTTLFTTNQLQKLKVMS